MTSPGLGTTDQPILEYAYGSSVTVNECNGTTPFGPFGTADYAANVLSVGVYTSLVNTSGTSVTGVSGDNFVTGGGWNGSTITIGGANYIISSVASTTTLTLMTSAGTQTRVVSLVPASGALTTWPPTTMISAINNGSANPVMFYGNGHYTTFSVTVYGAEFTACGSSTTACAPTNIPNYNSETLFLDRSDFENDIFNLSGGETSTNATGHFGTYYVRKNIIYQNVLSHVQTIDVQAQYNAGAYSGGTICDIENIYSDGTIGNTNNGFNGCTFKNIVAEYDFNNMPYLYPANQWASFTNVIAIRPSCTDGFYWGGNASNFFIDCPNATASRHVTGWNYSTIPIVLSSGIFQADSNYGEGHFLEGDGLQGSATYYASGLLEYNLILPSSSDGSISASLSIGVNTSGSTSTLCHPVTMLHNTSVGNDSSYAQFWITHAGTYSCANSSTTPIVPAFQSNLMLQTGATNQYSLMLGSPFATGGSEILNPPIPADQIIASSVGYNGYSGLIASTQFGVGVATTCSPSTALGTPYDICTTTWTGTPGSHDVQANPNFVDTTRNLQTWGVTQGVAASSSAAIGVYASTNPANYPVMIPQMLNWIRAGFSPTNPVFHNTAADGTDIGAVSFSASTPSTAVLINGRFTIKGQVIIQ